jgi:putative DNA primase/helicase
MTAHPAIDFLRALAPFPEARFSVQTFTDLPKGQKKPVPDPLCKQYQNLTLDAVATLIPNLTALNEQGAGVFVARNLCDGPRRERNVTRVLGVHADMDGVTEDQIERLTATLAPSISVQTSRPGHFQLYWQLANGELLEKDEAKRINQSLVEYGADQAAVDVSRLLRIAGFRHMKYQDQGETPLVVAQYSGLCYSAQEIRTAFIAKGPKQPMHERYVDTISNNQLARRLAVDRVSRIASQVAKAHPDLWNGNWQTAPRRTGAIGYPSSSEADLALAGHIARQSFAEGIQAEECAQTVEAIFSIPSPGQADKWKSRQDYRDRTIAKALTSNHSLSAIDGPNVSLESFGDIRNARAFASLARDRFLYVTTQGIWLRWEAERWQICEKDEPIQFAKDVTTRVLQSATTVLREDQERGKRLVTDAIALHNMNRIQAMLKLAISEPNMATTSAELDTDPYLLGVRNGVLDLRTSRLLFNQPSYLITRYCNASYDENAQCPRWEQFLKEVFQGEEETIQSVQRLLGYTLLGVAREEVLVICYGHGANGKSIFANVVHSILAGYSVTAPASLLTVRKAGDNSPRNDVASLAGARYASINELQAGDRLDEQVVKLLAGREKISARFLYKEHFDFLPAFTPWLRTNHKPIIMAEDDGLWRRLVLLPFKRKFSEDEQDPRLEEKLLAEADGILTWIVAGAKLYLTDGLKLSRAIRAEVAAYRSESDVLGEFLSDKTQSEGALKVLQGKLYSCYRIWCDSSGLRPITKKSFTQRLYERGFSEGKSGSNRYYLGLDLVPHPIVAQGAVDGLDSMGRIAEIFDKPPYIYSHGEISPKDQNPVHAVHTVAPSVEVNHD